MARQESDRENLLREATALVQRIELCVSLPNHDPDEHVVVGFRRDGCASIYLGSDPAYHFDSRDQLRRAYIDGQLLKAERGQLVAMHRVRSEGQVQLISRTLECEEAGELLSRLDQLRRELLDRLLTGDVRVVGQVPGDADVLARVTGWLSALKELSIAQSPHAR